MRCSPQTGSVQWFIGDDDDKPHNARDARGKAAAAHGRVVREGVEFYSNGDCYEGEFHKGCCNGSGVYNFFDKGKEGPRPESLSGPILDEASHVANKFAAGRSADFAGGRRSSAEHSNAACLGYTRGTLI
ncbi:hypothetical protein ZWY2020_038238 [Hordeum vulgare]|nr:hypothetical protein ZWY2020_038238 [Hordeum vulgare]